MFEWIPNKEHPYSPFVMLMIRAAYKSRELPYDSHDVTFVNEDGLQFLAAHKVDLAALSPQRRTLTQSFWVINVD